MSANDINSKLLSAGVVPPKAPSSTTSPAVTTKEAPAVAAPSVTAAPVQGAISAEAQQLSALMRELSLNKDPPVDSGKIARIQAEIANGTYKPNGVLIAQRLMMLEQALANREK